MKTTIALACFISAALAVGAGQFVSSASAQGGAGKPAFGSEQDVKLANQLWKAMQDEHLVGEGAIQVRPYLSSSPAHGGVLELMRTQLKFGDRTGEVLVKRNYSHYGPHHGSLQAVWTNPSKYMNSITIMYKMQKGYAPKSNDWFWAQYKPDGSLMSAPNGAKKVGQVPGCISCHTKAKQGFVFAIKENVTRK